MVLLILSSYFLILSHVLASRIEKEEFSMFEAKHTDESEERRE